MSIESGPQISKKEGELTPEDEEFVTENPELGQISMLEGAAALVADGQKNNDPEKIKQGLEVLNATKEEILTPRQDDSERASGLKQTVRRIWEEHGLTAGVKDIGAFLQEIESAEKGQKIKTIRDAAVKLSRRQGVLHLIEDIKRALKK